MHAKKIHQFLSSYKKMHTKENWYIFSASRSIHAVITDGSCGCAALCSAAAAPCSAAQRTAARRR